MTARRAHPVSSWESVLTGRPGAAVCFLAAFVPLLAWSWYHAAPGLTFHDSGEFGLASVCWGIPHPPGAPTWVLAAGAFVRLGGFDDPVRGTNLFSGLMAAITAGLAALLVRRWVALSRPAPAPAAGLAASLVAAGVLAGTRAFLDQAVITEQYTLLTALLAAVLLAATDLAATDFAATDLAAASRDAGGSGELRAAALGLLWGLACGNHLSQLALGTVVVWALAGAAGRDRRLLLRLGAWTAAGFLVGCAGFGWLVLRSRADPLLDWGDVETPRRLWWALTRREWGTRPLSEAPAGFAAAWLRSIDPAGQLGWAGLAVAVAGLARMGLGAPRRLAWLVLAVVPYAVGIFLATARQEGLGLDYVRHYGVTDWHLPLYLAGAVAAGWWVGVEAGVLVRRFKRVVGLGVALAVLILLVAAGGPARRQASLRDDTRPAEYVTALLGSLPRGALAALSEPDPAFMLGYARYAGGVRPDLTVAYTRPGVGPDLARVAARGRPWTAGDRGAFVSTQVSDPRRQPLRVDPPPPDAPLVTSFPREDAGAATLLLPAGLLFRVAPTPVDTAAVRAAELSWRRAHPGLVPAPDPAARLPVRAAWARLHFHRAEYFTLFGLWDLALGESGRAVAWLPTHAVAWYNRGFVLTRLGRVAEAEDSLRRALAADSRVAGPRTLLAQLALERGDRAGAADLLGEELARHPDDPQARALRDYLEGR